MNNSDKKFQFGFKESNEIEEDIVEDLGNYDNNENIKHYKTETNFRSSKH